MIDVSIVRGKQRELSFCSVSGHSGFASKGNDIVCAGCSSLVRTVLGLLEETIGVVLEVDMPERGILAFRVREYKDANKFLLVHCADFLEKGFSLLSKEYPKNVSLRVKTE